MKSSRESKKARGEPIGWKKARLREWHLEVLRMIADLDMSRAANLATALRMNPGDLASVADNHVIEEAIGALIEVRLAFAVGHEREQLLMVQRHFDEHAKRDP